MVSNVELVLLKICLKDIEFTNKKKQPKYTKDIDF